MVRFKVADFCERSVFGTICHYKTYHILKLKNKRKKNCYKTCLFYTRKIIEQNINVLNLFNFTPSRQDILYRDETLNPLNPLTVVPESHTGNDHALFDLFHAYFTAIESTKEQPTI